MPENLPPAGWYPERPGAPTERWWDGVDWTPHTRFDGIVQPAPQQQQQPDPAQPVQRKSGCFGILVLVLVLVLAGVFINGLLNASSLTDPDSQPENLTPATSLVLYEVTGTAPGASVTLTTPSGSQQHDVSLPMSGTDGTRGFSFEGEPGSFVYISAQNPGDIGTVSCKITVAGEVISENTSTAPYGIAQCDGSIDF
jgi:hypothetical protein